MKSMESGRAASQKTQWLVLHNESMAITCKPHEFWNRIDGALRHGFRGLPGNDSLARLLERYGRKQNHLNKPNLTEEIILKAADEYHNKTGKWPKVVTKDPVPGLPNETWISIHGALRDGLRGLSGRRSLAKLLDQNGRKQNHLNQPNLTEEIILKAADEYHNKTGKWPKVVTRDPVPGLPNETWTSINCALRDGLRGLVSNQYSLANLLHESGRKRNGRNHNLLYISC